MSIRSSEGIEEETMRTKCSPQQCWADHVTTSHHMLKKLEVRRGCTVPSLLT